MLISVAGCLKLDYSDIIKSRSKRNVKAMNDIHLIWNTIISFYNYDCI